MRDILINFADNAYRNSQIRNSASGMLCGFNSCHQYDPNDIDRQFYTENKNILDQSRGCGYWLWKPYFIWNQLNMITDNDVIFYSDAGADFVKNIDSLTNLCRDDKNGLISFKLAGNHKERQWTKRDVFNALDADVESITDTDQLMASFIIIRRTKFTEQFISDYLRYACNEQLITDLPSKSDNYPEFKDHRHDQSIYSILCKQRDVTQVNDPTQWGQKHKQFPASSQYIWHRRNNNHIKTEPRNLEGNNVRVIQG
jgi:hypothetical protein